MTSARIELAPSRLKLGIVTKSPCYRRSILLCSAARTTHRTHMHSSTAEEREVMMTDNGPQPPTKELATAVHHGPATRAWCGLLVLLDGVVALFCVLRMLSDVKISGVCFGQETENVVNIRTVEVLIFNPNGPYISVQSVRGSVTHRAAAERGRW